MAHTRASWSAREASEVDIRLGRPDGVSMGRHASYGTVTTGPWVPDGLTFYLQDGAKPLAAENTLGTVRIRLRR